MPFLRIPKGALPGLTAISNFSDQQIHAFANFLSSAPTGIRMNEIASFLNKDFALTSNQAEEIVQTIVSFRGLLEPVDIDFENLADKVTSSYKESTQKEVGNLKANLLVIFKNFKTLKLTLKADTLLSHESSIYRESRIVTDIRIIFSDDLEEKNRNAILIHSLNIEYFSSREVKNFHVAMTLEDLKDLQDVIERAIAKEGFISKDYSSNFKFISVTNQ